MPSECAVSYVPGAEYGAGAIDLYDPAFASVGAAAPLRGFEWSYTLGTASLTGVTRKAREATLDCTCSAGSAEAMQRAFERDVMLGTPGTLSVTAGGEAWSQRAYVPKAELSASHADGGAQASLTVVLLDGSWHSAGRMELMRASASSREWLNLPANAPYDLGASLGSAQLDTGWWAPCPVRLTVWGPASRPSLRIGANTYTFDVVVPDGCRLVADGTGARKSITLVDQNGDETDRFACGVRSTGLGSGSYCFQPIAPGAQEASWDGSFGVTVEWWRERGGLPWT